MKTRRGKKGEDETLTVFLSPPAVRGTAFLQHTRPEQDAEQWLYLPATEKIREIRSHGRKGSFVGTDFSFRDLELIEDVFDYSEEEAHAQLLGREPDANGSRMARIELTGASRDLGYERIVLWLSEPDLVLRRMEFFQEEAEPAKVLTFERIAEVAGIPTAHRLEMRQPAKRSSTSIDIEGVRYNTGLSENLFTDRALEHSLDEAE